MNTTHTPGPWEVKLSQDDEGTLCDIGVPDAIARCGQHVCRIHGWGFDYKADKEQQANARLIAAAPELLTGCEAALAYLADPPSVFPENRAAAVEIIRAALNKAKGIAS